MAPNVLVTGGAGFIGRYVMRRYHEAGWDVLGVGRSERPADGETLSGDYQSLDLASDALSKLDQTPELIIHCAGGGSVGRSLEVPRKDFDETLGSLASVLEFIRLSSPRTRLVYISSAAVYGQVDHVPISEQAPLSPVSPYGVHKLMAEMLCRSYAVSFSVAACIVRPFSIYGPGLRKQLLWDACGKLRAGDNEFFGSGKEVRDFLHVEDLANLVFLAAGNASTDVPVFNAATGVGVTTRSVLERISKRLGVAAPIFSGHAKGGDPSVYIGDVAKSRGTGWEPLISWIDGVDDYVDWHLDSI